MDTPPAVTAAISDTRGISLGKLAGNAARAAAESLRHVQPSEDTGRVTVAAFGSSI